MATKKTAATKSTKGGAKKGKTTKAAGAAAKGRKTAAASSSGVLSPRLNEVIGRALTDRSFRDQLFRDRAKAIRGFSLSKADKDALARVTPADLEQHATTFANKSALAVQVRVTVKF